jgi:hypothetical protein
LLPGFPFDAAADSRITRNRSRFASVMTDIVPHADRDAGIGFLSIQAPLAYRQKSSQGLHF